MAEIESLNPADIRPIPTDVLSRLRHSSPAERKQLSLWIPSYQEGQPSNVGGKFDNAVKHGLTRNELIFACVTKTAKAKGMPTLRVTDRKGKELPQHPLQTLLDAPNPYMSAADFWGAVTMFQKLSGHSYWEVVPARNGQPVQLWPLRPDWVQPVLTRKGVSAWQYKPAGVPDPIMLPPEQVIDLRLFDPRGLFLGLSPIQACGYTADTDNFITAFARNFFERGAMAIFALSSDQPLTEQDITQGRAAWRQRYGGHENWLDPAILPKGLSAQRLMMSFEEMGFEALDSRNETRICMVMDVPPIIVGANVGLERATYSNAEQAEVHWWRNSLVPDLLHDRDALARDLVPRFAGDVVLEWDWQEVPSLAEDEGVIATTARNKLESGGIMLDEYREMIGMDPIPGGKGQVFYISTRVNVTPVEKLGEEPPAPPPAMHNTPPGQNDNGSQNPQDGLGGATDMPMMDGTAKAVLGHPSASKVTATMPDHAPDDALRRKQERMIQDELEAFFAEQLTRIERELRRGRSS